MKWEVVFTKQAQKDARRIAENGLKEKATSLLEVFSNDPLQTPPPFEKLIGDLSGAYLRRINIQHRLVYQVYADARTVRVLRMWTHYEWRGELVRPAFRAYS